MASGKTRRKARRNGRPQALPTPCGLPTFGIPDIFCLVATEISARKTGASTPVFHKCSSGHCAIEDPSLLYACRRLVRLRHRPGLITQARIIPARRPRQQQTTGMQQPPGPRTAQWDSPPIILTPCQPRVSPSRGGSTSRHHPSSEGRNLQRPFHGAASPHHPPSPRFGVGVEPRVNGQQGAQAAAPRRAERPAIDLSWLPPKYWAGVPTASPPQGFTRDEMVVSRRRRLPSDDELRAANISFKQPWAKNSVTVDLNETTFRAMAGWAMDHNVCVGQKCAPCHHAMGTNHHALPPFTTRPCNAFSSLLSPRRAMLFEPPGLAHIGLPVAWFSSDFVLPCCS